MRLIDADALRTHLTTMGAEITRADMNEINKARLNVISDVKFILKNQPTISQWIPVSERLPKVDEYALISLSYGNVEWGWITATGRWVMEHFTLDDGEVLAWMPLPEPYKVGDTRDD